MSNKMLIDASHPEETRVVVTKGSRIEEFDFESEHKKQLKGNIYLARVTRVEPSLQAAFVEYGGNRHGFLAFSEIHPDYYQIPQADRQALLEAEEHSAREADAAELDAADASEDNAGTEKTSKKSGRSRRKKTAKEAVESDSVSEELAALQKTGAAKNTAESDDEDSGDDEKPVDLLGAEDALEELPARNLGKQGANWRNYKIQEVVKRRQILLVQIVKEERGNKGAALTTYLSLAGRYSVLMPNTARGGGISRKITGSADRKRLKDIVKDLSVPRGMGIILRTAGANRNKTEVRRDYEYLIRLWENVRNLTLSSIAPALVYEEGSLIKRSIRDLYNKDINEVQVAGDAAYREAKDFMRMLMPSHAKYVQPYRELTPIFARRGIETQLDSILQPEVGLKSGGYLVINQTEALVAIDVNSGRSTREHSVEETALQTNLEAAEEVARQLRLRDLAGLIVIDFIDMQEKRNIRAVEKRLKDCLKEDRARIQVGRISHFGLMEMSRQRIRASVLESTTQPCPHCFGRGYVRSQSSLALQVLRAIEEYLQRSSSHNLIVKTPAATALYVLNHKRRALTELEERFNLVIDIEADDSVGKEYVTIHKTSELAAQSADKPDMVESESTAETLPEAVKKQKTSAASAGRAKNTKTNAKNEDSDTAAAKPKIQLSSDSRESAQTEEESVSSAGAEENSKRKRRRGRRGGRRSRDNSGRSATAAVQNKNSETISEENSESDTEKTMSADYILHSHESEDRIEHMSESADSGIHDDIVQNNAVQTEKMQNHDNYVKDSEKHEAAKETYIQSKQVVSSEDWTQSAAPDPKKASEGIRGSSYNFADVVSEAQPAYNKFSSDIMSDDSSQAVQSENENTERQNSIKTDSAEPIVTSDNMESGKETTKKKGWWGRKSFF